jgi:hypothetical protein
MVLSGVLHRNNRFGSGFKATASNGFNPKGF